MKTLRYFFIAALAMVGMNVMADDAVVFDFTDAAKIASYGLTAPTEKGTFTEFSSCTYEGITISSTNGTTSTRIFMSNPQQGDGVLTLRFYKNSTLTVSGSSIKSITFDTNANGNLSTTTGTYADGVWSGDAESVTFNVSATTQIKTITISGEGGGTPPTPPTVETKTVAEALALIDAMEAGTTTTEEYKMTAYIVGDPEWKPYTDKQTGELKNYNLSLYIGDTAGAATKLYVYNIFNLDNSYFLTIDQDVANGVQVELQGKFQKYKAKDESITPEVVKAHFLRIGTKTGIEAVKAQNTKFEGKVYNIAGQQVTESYKGLVIMNGKKMILK